MGTIPGPKYRYKGKKITKGTQGVTDHDKEKLCNYVRSEFEECATDFIYFCEKYVTIEHPIRGKIMFELRDYQKRAFYAFENNRFNIIKKCRQLGLSTLAAAYILWKCLFNNSYTVVIISKGDREAKEVLRKIRIAYEALQLDPEIKKVLSEMSYNVKEIETVIKGKTVKNDQHELEWDNGSRVISLPSNAGRSFACSLLILDEAAFCRNIEELWAGAYPTLSTGGNCIVISTTNKTVGIGKWYYQTWIKAEAHENDFNAIDIKWWENPEHDTKWLESMYKNLGPEIFKQEVLGLFLVGGNTVLPAKTIEYWENKVEEPVLKKEQRNLWIWEPPVKGERYILTVDTSGESGNSCSAFEILKLSTLEQVAEYRSKTYTKRFARIIAKWSEIYNNCFIVVERNYKGEDVARALKDDHKCLHIYKPKGTKKLGVTTTGSSRMTLVSNIESALLDRTVGIKSSRFIREIQNFIYDKRTGKPKHASGETDDLIICLGLAITYASKASISMPIGFLPDKKYETIIGFDKKTNAILPVQVDKNNKFQDLRWLFD